MNPLAVEIWCSIAIAYVLVSLTIWIVARFSPFEWQPAKPPCDKACEHLLANRFRKYDESEDSNNCNCVNDVDTKSLRKSSNINQNRKSIIISTKNGVEYELLSANEFDKRNYDHNSEHYYNNNKYSNTAEEESDENLINLDENKNDLDGNEFSNDNQDEIMMMAAAGVTTATTRTAANKKNNYGNLNKSKDIPGRDNNDKEEENRSRNVYNNFYSNFPNNNAMNNNYNHNHNHSHNRNNNGSHYNNDDGVGRDYDNGDDHYGDYHDRCDENAVVYNNDHFHSHSHDDLDNMELTSIRNEFTLRNSFWFAIGTLMQQGSDLYPKVSFLYKFVNEYRENSEKVVIGTISP